MKTKLKQILGRTDDVLQNYAFVLLAALLAALSVVSLIHQENTITADAKFNLLKMAFTAALGISLLFALNMLSERIGKKIALNILGVGFLAVYFFFVFPKTEKDFTEVYAPILVVSALLTHLLVSFSAFLRKNNELSFWQYNKNLFINIVLTAIFTGVLVGGILLAITAIDHLFDFDFNQKLYPETFTFFAIFGSCFIFLLFNEEGLKFLEKDGKYPEILKFFVQFVLIPLLLIYVVILYFYGGKILMNWSLPRGWVSYLILAYSIVGILALLLVYPLKEILEKSWIKIFHKIFYYSLIPLIILLFVAIKTRILEYGYTENRYYVLLLAIWISVLVLYFTFKKNPNIKSIPISLFAFGLFSLIMPYFNAFAVSKRSQKTELKNILTKNNLLEKGKINFTKPVQDSVVIEIADKFQFLNDRKESALLLNYISKNKQSNFKKILEKDRYLVNSEVRMSFKNKIFSKPKSESENFTQGVYSNKKNFNISGFEKIIFYKNNGAEETEIIDHYNLIVSPIKKENVFVGYQIQLESPNKKTEIYDLTPFLKEMLQQDYLDGKFSPVEEISTEFDLQPYHFKIYISEITNNKFYKKDNLSVRDLVILVKKN